MRYAILAALMLPLMGCDYGKRLDAMEARVSQLEAQVAEIQEARKMRREPIRQSSAHPQPAAKPHTSPRDSE